MVTLAPRIFGICQAVLAQSPGGFNRFQEFTDDLLHSLAMEMGIATFSPFLPSAFRGPLPVGTTNAKMALQQIIPEARGLCPGLLIDGPLLGTRWCEVNLYRAVNHRVSILKCAELLATNCADAQCQIHHLAEERGFLWLLCNGVGGMVV